MVKIVFTADSMEGFLISSSMVGLGLILAIYSFTLPRIRDILKRRTIKLKRLIEERDDIFKKMIKDKANTKLTKDYKIVQEGIEITGKLPFHLDLGYMLVGTSFAISLTISLFRVIVPDNYYIVQLMNSAVVIFVLGITFFLIIWYLMFVEFRTYAVEEFEKVKDGTQDKNGNVTGFKIEFDKPIKYITQVKGKKKKICS